MKKNYQKPSAGLTKAEKSKIVKKAKKGKKFSKTLSFDELQKKATKFYKKKGKSAKKALELGKNIAGKVFWKREAAKKKAKKR